MTEPIKIGRRIKERREELGLTQEQLGNKLWLNKSTIQRYENGKIKTIKLPVIQSIAESLSVNPDWIIGKTDIKTVNNVIELKNHSDNSVVIFNRNGEIIKKKFSEEQMKYLEKFIESLADEDNTDL